MNLSAEQFLSRGLDATTAEQASRQVARVFEEYRGAKAWQRLTGTVLQRGWPFAVHQWLYELAYSDWTSDQGPRPAWFPAAREIEGSNISEFCRQQQLADFAELFRWSVEQRAEFWDAVVRRLGIPLDQPYQQIVDLHEGAEHPRWMVGGRLNISDSCFQADPDKTAIWYHAADGRQQSLSYGQLDQWTGQVAAGLRRSGLGPGDAVGILMPMTPESVAAYLAVVRIGGAVVSIADSFAAPEIALRLRISRAKAIFVQDVIHRGGKELPLYDKLRDIQAPPAIVVAAGSKVSLPLRAADQTWDDFLPKNSDREAVPREPHDVTNILFSSGTTGDPKAIPWSQTTPIKCASDAYFHHDVHSDDVLAWPTNLGWMMGPWLIYASLVNRAGMALYGGMPTELGFVQFVERAGVTMLGVIPSLVRNWRSQELLEQADWSGVRRFSSTGECSNVDDMLYLMASAGYRPVIEYCGGTEIGGGYVTGTMVQAAAPATFTTPTLGLDLRILDEQGQPANRGEVFLVPPSIGLSLELLNRDHHQVYYADTPTGDDMVLRRHGDQLERLPGGFFCAHGRTDDTMNLGGIKVGSAEIERALEGIAGVRETAAVAVRPASGGPDELVIYAVPDATASADVSADPAALWATMQQIIKRDLNPLFKISRIELVEALPRTASNKVMRRMLR